ncbi:hypothetical protein RMCBS344292_05381 [Rhizopus microsporus]|nr:hypothetical protein RMCBS344292_05381 [Rhizopus microsporus]
MSLITDPLYLIHISRIKFLRVDERGERIISFPPTVMSDDYVRLAAPLYPEMQYCYSPPMTESKLTTSPRTTKRSYRHRKQYVPIRPLTKKETDSDEEEEEDMDEEERQELENKIEEQQQPPVGLFNATHPNQEETSLHPSVESAIDPSPRSSIEEANVSMFPFPTSSHESPEDQPEKKITQVVATEHPLSYTKKVTPIQQQQKSALSALIAEKATAAENPFAEYAFASGKGEAKPINLCVYIPCSFKPYEPVKLIVKPDALIDDVIGYILYDYVEQKRGPELEVESYDLSEWVLLIAEDDGEIEEDLPAVDRTRRIDRVSFDQFALFKQNDITRAKMGKTKPDIEALRQKKQQAVLPESTTIPTSTQQEDIPTHHLMHHRTAAQEPDPSTVAVPVPSSKATLTKATMPMTPLKYFRIKLMTNEEVSATTAIPVYAEMFIGDVLELVCRKRKLDANGYMLTIADTNVIVPNDTTVESMKEITDLTLVKKERTLTIPSTIDGDYIHLMPPEHKGMFDSVKTTSFHASAIRSCKQSKKVPSNFKIIVFKERDYKTYDLEAESSKEAYEICARIRFLMQVTKGA